VIVAGDFKMADLVQHSTHLIILDKFSSEQINL